MKAVLSILGRLCLCTIFLMAAVGNKIPNFNKVAGYMQSKGVPYHQDGDAPYPEIAGFTYAQIMLIGAIAFLIVGSVSVVIGLYARFGAAPGHLPRAGDVLFPRLLGRGDGQGARRADDPVPEEPVDVRGDAFYHGQRIGGRQHLLQLPLRLDRMPNHLIEAGCQEEPASRRRLRVAAPFFAEAERRAAVRDADAAPPFLPPLVLEAWLSFLPRPLPDFLPPPDSLLTVAQALPSASFLETPRSS